MLRRTLIAAALIALALPGGAAAQRALKVSGGRIVDDRGRQVILHGVNVVYKRPPYYPAASGPVANTFTRTDDAYRGVYELLKTGRMPEAESMAGKLFNAILGEGKEGVLRTQRIDGSKLPDYDMVRRYLGPAGMTITSESDGWFLTGFTLNKEVR